MPGWLGAVRVGGQGDSGASEERKGPRTPGDFERNAAQGCGWRQRILGRQGVKGLEEEEV